MAIKVTGYFKNPETDLIVDSPLLFIQFHGLPKGRLAVDVNIMVLKESEELDEKSNPVLVPRQVGAFPYNIELSELDTTEITTSSFYGELLRRIQAKLIEYIPTTGKENSKVVLTLV